MFYITRLMMWDDKKKVVNPGMAILFLLLFMVCLAGQTITGFHVYNESIVAHRSEPFTLAEYLLSGHFLVSLFANWQSEFLLMGILILLLKIRTAPQHPLVLNERSLLIFALLFLLLFGLHFYSSLLNFNNGQILRGKPVKTISNYLLNNRFWWECFRNWQSVFLALFILAIFRKKPLV